MSEYEYGADSIQVLKGHEAIRKRPGMYIGDTSERGLQHLVLEIFSNAVDAAMKMDNPTVTIHSLYPEVKIEDNGAGISFDFNEEEEMCNAELYFTKLHCCSTADNHAPHVHLGINWGVGATAVNALSSLMDVKSWRDGKRWHIAFRRGETKIPAEVVKEGEGNGTIVSFAPDPEIFARPVVNERSLRAVIFQSVHLIPGLTVKFLDEVFHAKSGLSDLLPVISPAGNISSKSFAFNDDIDDFHLNVCLEGNGDSLKDMKWFSWANGGVTAEHGSHVKAVRKALKKVKWTPASGLVHIIHYAPCYAGPSRGKLELEEIEERITEVLTEKLIHFVTS